MARLCLVMTGIVGILGGCSTQAQPFPKEGPALCAAAFIRVITLAKGTPLENDPQILELRVRTFFEILEVHKTHSLAAGQKNVTALALQLKPDQALAASKRCLVEEETGGEYRVIRSDIIAAMEKAGKKPAGLTN